MADTALDFFRAFTIAERFVVLFLRDESLVVEVRSKGRSSVKFSKNLDLRSETVLLGGISFEISSSSLDSSVSSGLPSFTVISGRSCFEYL